MQLRTSWFFIYSSQVNGSRVKCRRLLRQKLGSSSAKPRPRDFEHRAKARSAVGVWYSHGEVDGGSLLLRTNIGLLAKISRFFAAPYMHYRDDRWKSADRCRYVVMVARKVAVFVRLSWVHPINIEYAEPADAAHKGLLAPPLWVVLSNSDILKRYPEFQYKH